MKIWNGDQIGGPGWLIFACMRDSCLPSWKLFRAQTSWCSSLIWITNVFRFSIVHKFWSVEEFSDTLKAGDNDFHPQDHHRGPPFYWPLYCCPVLAPKDRLPVSHWFTIVASKKTPLGSVSLFFQWLSSCLLPCSGSSLGLSKTIQFCHVAKSLWHPFTMLIRGMLWIFTMLPWACEKELWREENDRHQLWYGQNECKVLARIIWKLDIFWVFCCCFRKFIDPEKCTTVIVNF